MSIGLNQLIITVIRKEFMIARIFGEYIRSLSITFCKMALILTNDGIWRYLTHAESRPSALLGPSCKLLFFGGMSNLAIIYSLSLLHTTARQGRCLCALSAYLLSSPRSGQS